MTQRAFNKWYYPECWCGEPWTRTCARENQTWDGKERAAHFKNAFVQVEVPILCSCGKEVWQCDDYKAFKEAHVFDEISYRPIGAIRLRLSFIFDNNIKEKDGAEKCTEHICYSVTK
jgi:hypothetical protein